MLEAQYSLEKNESSKDIGDAKLIQRLHDDNK